MIDWSQAVLGALPSEVDDEGQEFVVAFASRSCHAAKKEYCSYDGESFPVISTAQRFKHYLVGASFTVTIDHHFLKGMMSSRIESYHV